MTHTPRRGLAVAVGAAVVAGLAACAPQPAEPEVTTLDISVIDSFNIAANWNPVTSTYINLFFTPQQAVYEPLFRLNPGTYGYDPVLAEEYEVSEDQHSMDIRLREDVDFTDGTHLDAQTVKDYFDIFSQTDQGWAYFFQQNALEVEVTGEYELTFRMDRRMDNDFLYNFALIPIVSPTAIREDPVGLETSPVGTGPYILEEQIPEVSVTFVRNPDYRDPEAYPFEELHVTVFIDSIAASNALKSGQLNAAKLDPSLAADAEANGFVVRAGGGWNYVLIWKDPDGAIVPQLADARVRQAIAYAIDRESITATIDHGYGTVTSQAWGEGSPFHIEGEDDRYAYDLERARELMAEAGYADGFSMRMPTSVTFADYDPLLVQAFADIGITLEFEQFQSIADMDTSGYAMFLWQTSDIYASDQMARPLPQLADEFQIVDTGTADEVAAAQQAIGTEMLDEAYVIAVSRPADTWATIPEITLDPGIIPGWPPLLQGFQLTD